ncbi:hypothetical protein GX51_08337, partial [Blastomyces parvus]
MRAMGKAIFRHYYNRDIIQWNNAKTTITVKGTEIILQHLYAFINKTICQTTTEFCDLIQVEENYLTKYSPSNFRDNWAYDSNGFGPTITFKPRDLNTPMDFLQSGLWRLMDRLDKTSCSFIKIVNGQLTVDPSTTKQFHTFCRRIDKFLLTLAVLFVMVSGLPMRGQELLKIKHLNDTTTLRNILLHFDHILLLNEYNKSESIKDKPMVIARYLPEQIGRIVIAYLTELKPLRDLCVSIFKTQNPQSNDLSHHLAPLFFSSPEHPEFTTEMVSGHMGYLTESELGVRVKMAKWRHLAIAIYRMFLEQKATKIDNATKEQLVSIFQTGHSEDTSNHHYAVTADMLAGTTDQTL